MRHADIRFQNIASTILNKMITIHINGDLRIIFAAQLYCSIIISLSLFYVLELLHYKQGEDIKKDEPPPPPDKFFFVRITIFLLGLSSLLTSMFITSAYDVSMFNFKISNNATRVVGSG